MDPNWFYSTLAQSTAAIIGLAGGFMVNRVLQQRNEIAPDREQARALFEELWWRINEWKTYAGIISEQPKRFARSLSQVDEAGGDVRIDTAQLASFSHVPGWTTAPSEASLTSEGAQAIRDLAVLASEFEGCLPTQDELALRIRKGRAWRAPTHSAWLGETVSGEIHGLTNANYFDLLPEQRDVLRNAWYGFGRLYEDVLGDVASLRARIAATTLYGLVAVLGGLLVASLIVPLFYLTARGGHSRSWLLAMFVVLAVAFLVFLANEVRRLQHSLDFTRRWW